MGMAGVSAAVRRTTYCRSPPFLVCWRSGVVFFHRRNFTINLSNVKRWARSCGTGGVHTPAHAWPYTRRRGGAIVVSETSHGNPSTVNGDDVTQKPLDCKDWWDVDFHMAHFLCRVPAPSHSITSNPLTMVEVEARRWSSPSSAIVFPGFEKVDLGQQGGFNLEAIDEAIEADPAVKLLHVQRSCGYRWRPSLSVGEIERYSRNLQPFCVFT